MNDTHMSHAMEFPYPQSMANCATCHEGKLDMILADENFTFETCKSCHPVEGNGAWPDQAYEQDARATPFTYLWTVKHNVPFHLNYTNETECTDCHNSELGASAPAFAALHTGYDARI